MTEPIDPNQSQKEFLESIRKMFAQMNVGPDPQAERVREEEEEKKKAQKRLERLQFNLKPKDVKRYLDRYVIKQDDAKRVLATAICDHYQHVRRCEGGSKCKDYNKQNIIMLGPTGVGKTYLIRSLSDLIGVPFTKADATKFSETGYVGGDVEDLIRDLVHKADGDIQLAECGMVYLDEVDKIAAASNLQGRDVSGSGVQRGLLKIMEDTDVSLRNPQDVQSQIQAMMEFQQKGKISRPVVSTRHILFIVSGSFSELAPIIEKRLKGSRIGFYEEERKKRNPSEVFREAKTEDFIQFGFEPEFIGRLPVRVTCDPLSAEDLYQILTQSEGSVLKQYADSFEAYGIKIIFEDRALWEIAKRAYEEKTGARGLVTILERTLRDLKYELPSSLVKEFRLTQEMVASSRDALETILREERNEKKKKILEEIKQYEASFLKKTGVRIEFDEPASAVIEERVLEKECPAAVFLDALLSNYAYGLSLIQKKKPQDFFRLAPEVIFHPNEVLEKWIKESYED